MDANELRALLASILLDIAQKLLALLWAALQKLLNPQVPVPFDKAGPG